MFSEFNSVEMVLYGYKSKCSVLKFWALICSVFFPIIYLSIKWCLTSRVLLCFEINGNLLPFTKIMDHF